MQEDHIRVLGVDLIEDRPDPVMILVVLTGAESDAVALGGQALGLAPPLGLDEVAAVDQRRGVLPACGVGTVARAPGRSGAGTEVLGGGFAQEFEGVAPLQECGALCSLALELDAATSDPSCSRCSRRCSSSLRSSCRSMRSI